MPVARLCLALAVLAVGGVFAETGWQVCTIEGLMSLSDSAACEILPPFTLLENAMRATAFMLRKLDEFADDHERDLQHSFINRRIGIVPPPFGSAGAGADFTPDRRIEGYISSDFFAPRAINRSEECYCNPYWLQYQETNYIADPQLGIPCETFCDASKYLAIAEHIPNVADEFDAESGNLFRGATLATFYATSSYVMPWAWWISQGIALALVVPLPNVVWPGVYAAGPDRKSVV